MALSTLAGTINSIFQWTATLARTGLNYAPVTVPDNFAKAMKFGTAAANAALTNGIAGADEVVSKIYVITSSGNASIDLTSLTDVVGQTAITLARIKGICIRLLSVADDATNGTAATSVTIDNTVTNALHAQSHSGWFDNANEGLATGGMGDATGSKITIPSGGMLLYALPNAAGVVVDSTHKIIKVVNNDGGVSAAVQVTLIGGTT